MGVSLKHLGVELSEDNMESLTHAVEDIGRELRGLDEVKCPRDKLAILLRVHKILVDGLTFPADTGLQVQSSSADLLLPVLIYKSQLREAVSYNSVIQANTETLVSNIKFIQRFRAESLLEGEASYCLTNLVYSLLNSTNHRKQRLPFWKQLICIR